jgi:quinol monooxygenase YgiN
MIHVVTYIEAAPSSIRDAITHLKQYRSDVAHNGAVEAALLQESRRENRFVVLEAWTDESSMKADWPWSRLDAIRNCPPDRRVHLSFDVAVGGSSGNAFCVVTHVDVPPPRREETEVLLRSLVENSRRHAGALRYDVFQQLAPRTNHFTVVAVWRDEQDFLSYEVQSATRRFRDALGPMLGAPYDERLYRLL